MRRLAGAAAMLAALTMTATGCSSPGIGEPTPTPTEDANAVACQEFEDVSTTLSDVIKIDQIAQPWEDLRNKFDSVGLKAEGDVKERIAALVDEWPDVAQILVYRKFDSYNEPVDAVARACEAAGTPIEPLKFAGS
jgi:hypothetical protein